MQVAASTAQVRHRAFSVDRSFASVLICPFGIFFGPSVEALSGERGELGGERPVVLVDASWRVYTLRFVGFDCPDSAMVDSASGRGRRAGALGTFGDGGPLKTSPCGSRWHWRGSSCSSQGMPLMSLTLEGRRRVDGPPTLFLSCACCRSRQLMPDTLVAVVDTLRMLLLLKRV